MRRGSCSAAPRKAPILAAAAHPKLAAAVFALSPERYLPGFDVEPAAAKLRVPTLVAVSRDDAYSASDAPDVERHVGAACRARSTFVHTVAGVPPLYVTPFERRIAPPLLVVGSKDDPLIPQRDVARLLAKAPSRAKSSVLVPGSAHGWDLLQGSDASKRVRHAVAQFLANAGAPAATGCSA